MQTNIVVWIIRVSGTEKAQPRILFSSILVHQLYMKQLLFSILFCMVMVTAFAQTGTTDSTQRLTDTVKHTRHKVYKFKLSQGLTHAPDSTQVVHKAPGFSWGITFSRFDIGLSTLLDNGSFKLSPQNNFLRYRSWRSVNVGFDVLQAGYRFTPSFKIYLSAGFDWTHLFLRDNVTILEHQPVLTYRVDNVNYTKDRFTSSYLRIPLSFEYRTRSTDEGRYFHIIAGPDMGILLDGSLKQESDANGKQKFYNNYNFARVRYGGFARVGYGPFGVYAKYYFNDMFVNSPAQDGLKSFTFGGMFFF